MGIREAFEANLEFISRTELDADLMERTFSKTDTRDHLAVGTADLPTGRIRVGDPLSYMGTKKYSPQLIKTVTPGSYPVELAFIHAAFVGTRITAARIKISDEKAVRYELAEPTHETAAFHASDGDASGFPVEAGMMSFMDASVMEEYAAFLTKWHEENPDKNHYDDYFAALFAESSEEHQRPCGDIIEWKVPGTEHRLVMNTSGFGDGFYQVYFGFDKDGGICEVTVPLINADLIDEANKEYLRVWDGIDACIVTNHIAEGADIAYMCRETEEGSYDNGWVFYGYDEDEDYWGDSNNFCMYSTHALCERYPELIPLLHSPAGTAYIRSKDGTFELHE